MVQWDLSIDCNNICIKACGDRKIASKLEDEKIVLEKAKKQAKEKTFHAKEILDLKRKESLLNTSKQSPEWNKLKF